jgi:hypothetical protein
MMKALLEQSTTTDLERGATEAVRSGDKSGKRPCLKEKETLVLCMFEFTLLSMRLLIVPTSPSRHQNSPSTQRRVVNNAHF